ncbi:hypothetical protein NIES2100_35680 [Calothrix sp. NIES-2100]|nr:hypothetical protein NIES2100_35680 [Calothrix sp. NIES-2100]
MILRHTYLSAFAEFLKQNERNLTQCVLAGLWHSFFII